MANEIGAPVSAPNRPVAWDSQTNSWMFDTDVFGRNVPRSDIQPDWQTFIRVGIKPVEPLKQLVLYKERDYSGGSDHYPSIADNIGVLDATEAERIANYLRRGKVLIEFVSPTPDPYNPSDLVRNVVLSDGIYTWDGIILNWVEKYRIGLPKEFIDHVNTVYNSIDVNFLDSKELLKEFKRAKRIMIS